MLKCLFIVFSFVFIGASDSACALKKKIERDVIGYRSSLNNSMPAMNKPGVKNACQSKSETSDNQVNPTILHEVPIGDTKIQNLKPITLDKKKSKLNAAPAHTKIVKQDQYKKIHIEHWLELPEYVLKKGTEIIRT